MRTRTLGQGLEVSALGLGCMGISQSFGPAPDRATAVDFLRTAVDRGVTFFDTAEVYGPYDNEEIVGEALEPVRDQVVIATKFGFAFDARRQAERRQQPAGGHPRRGRRVAAAAAHRRHRPALPAPRRPGRAHRGRGRDRQGAGRGGQGPPLRAVRGRRQPTIRRAHAVQPVTALQSEYSLFWREPEESVLPTLEELGIGFVPFSPLGRGILTGQVTRESTFGEGDIRATLPRFAPEALATNLDLVDLVAAVADRLRRHRPGRSPSPGCSPSSRGSSRSPAPAASNGSTRTSVRPSSSSTDEDLAELTAASDSVDRQGDRYPEAMQAHDRPLRVTPRTSREAPGPMPGPVAVPGAAHGGAAPSGRRAPTPCPLPP